MDNNDIIIYAKHDEKNLIIRIVSNIFLDNTEGYEEIDRWVKGEDRYLYAHADNGEYVLQKHGKPLYDENGIPNFKKGFVEWTDEKKETLYPQTENIKAEQEATLQNMMLASARASFLVELPDEEAIKIPYCYDSWDSYIGKPLPKLNEQGKENRIEYDGKLWKVRNDIPVVLENQAPGIETAALYERIDVEHEGTLEDPIPYDQTMTVYEGKYYIENEKIYKCIRDSGQPLYATCESLVGNYFELV